MYRVYEIFEVPPNGSPQRVTVVSGLEFARMVLEGLAKRTTNECFAADAETRQVVMQKNLAPATLRRIFQIAYDMDLGLRRAEVLRSRGYGVISVVGNDAAKVLLSSPQHYDLFIVGHSAPEEIRREIVAWLKAQYPSVKILALNPPDHQLPAADYNVRHNETETWLPIVFQQLSRPATGGA